MDFSKETTSLLSTQGKNKEEKVNLKEIEADHKHKDNLTIQNNTSKLQKEEKPKDTKKKQAPFLQREIKISKTHDLNEKQLLEDLKKNYEKNLKIWTNRAKRFKAANFVITLMVVLIQVAQVITFQLKQVPTDTQKALATILPCITSAALAIQLKLSWSEKSIKSKRSAGLYNKLLKHVSYRLQVINAGAEIEDTVKVWNSGLLSEVQDVPAFLLLY